MVLVNGGGKFGHVCLASLRRRGFSRVKGDGSGRGSGEKARGISHTPGGQRR
jgi:hypothetical protein